MHIWDVSSIPVFFGQCPNLEPLRQVMRPVDSGRSILLWSLACVKVLGMTASLRLRSLSSDLFPGSVKWGSQPVSYFLNGRRWNMTRAFRSSYSLTFSREKSGPNELIESEVHLAICSVPYSHFHWILEIMDDFTWNITHWIHSSIRTWGVQDDLSFHNVLSGSPAGERALRNGKDGCTLG